MNIIVDANILFSTLIKEGKSAEILINPLFNLYTPEFVLEEISKHKEEILNKTHRNEEEFEEILDVLNELIIIIPESDFNDKIKEAKKFSPDPDDVDYFALALKLNCPIWSEDKKLKEQDNIKIYSTSDLIKEFGL